MFRCGLLGYKFLNKGIPLVNMSYVRNYGKFKSLITSNQLVYLPVFIAVRKRFFKKTDILYSNGKYEVTLDQRKLKTPKGNLFTVDSESLALAVATEWDSQKEKLDQSTMHLVRNIMNTVVYFHIAAKCFRALYVIR